MKSPQHGYTNCTHEAEPDSHRGGEKILWRSATARTHTHGLLINMASATSAPALAPSTSVLPVSRLVGVGLIIFFANAALLVLQLVASRLLAPFVGSSLETWTSIIGIFLV